MIVRRKINTKTRKEIILNYCDNIKTGDIDHLQACIDIRESLRRNENYRSYLYDHCPKCIWA